MTKTKIKMKLLNMFKKRDTEISIDTAIHSEVYSAQELLLSEANKLLSEIGDVDQEKRFRMQRLRSLGFYNAEEVKRFNEKEEAREHHEFIKERIEYYKREYPFNKFIDEKTVEKVCLKYKLYLSKVQDYIAEIPEKNQKEIINFKVKRSDARDVDVYGEFYVNRPLFRTDKEEAEYKNAKLSGRGLQIVAPEHKFDWRGKEKNGYKLKIKDPIVLQPVLGGYLIVSSWGLEAGDAMVTNEINN